MSNLTECPSCALPTDTSEPACTICGYEFPETPRSTSVMAWVFAALMVLFAFPMLGRLAGCLG
ncbi:MAG: zinc ribbon domain-containing protein [Bacteroidota bacterium]